METLNMTDLNTTTLKSTENTVNLLAELEIANSRFTHTLIPCIIYAGVLILVGIIGNTLVCYVFGFRLKRCAQNYFILFLAVFDLLSCTIGLPAEIVDMALHFMYNSAALCKIMRLINTFTALSSILTLIIIAVDRYRRVRKPLKTQISSYHAKLSLIPIIIVALFFSSPSVFVYGLRTVDSGIPGITGLDCTISDEAKTTMVPLIYNSSLFLCFLILATSLIAMYSLILRSLKKHAITLRKASIGTLSTGTGSIHEPCSITDNSTSTSRGTDVEKPFTHVQENEFSNSSHSSVTNKSSNTDENDDTNSYRDNEDLKVEVTDKVQQTTSQRDSPLHENMTTLQHSSTNLETIVYEPSKTSSPVMEVEKNCPIWEFRNKIIKPSESIIGSSVSSNVENTDSDNGDANVDSSVNDCTIDNGKSIITDCVIEKVDCMIKDCAIQNIDSIIKDCVIENQDQACQSISYDDPQYCLTQSKNNDEYDNNYNKKSDRQTCNIKISKQSTIDCESWAEDLKNSTVCEQPKDKVCHVDAPLDGDNTHHHVSFDVNNDTLKKDMNTPSNVLAIIFDRKRRMSETPFLDEQELETKGYLNPAFKFKAAGDTQQTNHMCSKLEHQKPKKPEKENAKQRNITRKTTIIAFVVTLVFILSFVPHLCLQVAHIIRKGFDEKLEGAPLALYNIFLRSYFINNVANPIIYGVLNENFRTEVKVVLEKLRCWKPRKI